MSILRNMSNQSLLIKGNKKGPYVAIMGCTHGNERIGAEILDWLSELINLDDVHGKIQLILGNPMAYDQDVRFIDTDLNRIMSDERLTTISNTSPKERNHEEHRAIELAGLLKNVNYLLDIHATVKPTKHPFVYAANTPEHHKLSALFEVDYIMSEQDKSVTSYPEGPMDFYADRQDGIGITLEAGCLSSTGLLEDTKIGVARFLKTTGVLPNIKTITKNTLPKKLIIYKELIAKTDQYQFTGDHDNMKFFSVGDKIAQDGNEEIIVDRDCYLIFPKINIHKGKEAGYLAEKT